MTTNNFSLSNVRATRNLVARTDAKLRADIKGANALSSRADIIFEPPIRRYIPPTIHDIVAAHPEYKRDPAFKLILEAISERDLNKEDFFF